MYIWGRDGFIVFAYSNTGCYYFFTYSSKQLWFDNIDEQMVLYEIELQGQEYLVCFHFVLKFMLYHNLYLL